MCEILLREVALFDKPDNEGKTALYNTSSCGHFQICHLLIENKVPFSKKQMKVQLHFQWLPKIVMLIYVPCYLRTTLMSTSKIMMVYLHCR